MNTPTKMFVALMMILGSQIGTFARPFETESFRMNAAIKVTGTFTAQATLSPVAGAEVNISVATFFEGLTGFENATLTAEVTNGGATLTVFLSGVTVSELPANTVLGQVKLVDENGQRDFIVSVDGGGTIDLADIF